MRVIKQIVVHCADTPTGRKTTVEDIDSWHVDRGFKRIESNRLKLNPKLKAIGYHFVIYIDGSIHTGRSVEEIGAHVSGLNSTSIGICMIGKGTYNALQWNALRTLVKQLQGAYPEAKILGHYQTPTGFAQGKQCPGFDIPMWLANNMEPEIDHIG